MGDSFCDLPLKTKALHVSSDLSFFMPTDMSVDQEKPELKGITNVTFILFFVLCCASI